MKRFTYFALGLFLVVLFSRGYAVWWDNDWDYNRGVTITATVDLNAGFPVDLNATDFNFTSIPSKTCGDLSDLRVVYNGSEIAASVENLYWRDSNRLWFELQAPIASGNTDYYEVYYGNPACPARTIEPDFNLMALDANIASSNATLGLWHFDEPFVPGATSHMASGMVNDLNFDRGQGVLDLNVVDANGPYGRSVCSPGDAFSGAFLNETFYNITGNGVGTIEFFFMVRSFTDATDVLFGGYKDATTEQRIEIDDAGGSEIFPALYYQNGATEVNVRCGTIGLHEWHHLMLKTGGGATNGLYLDGNLCNVYVAGSMADDTAWRPMEKPEGLLIQGGQIAKSADACIDEFRISSYAKDNNGYLSYDLSSDLQNHAILSIGTNEIASQVTADFTYTTTQVSSDGKVINYLDANDSSTYSTVTPTAWEWFLNGALISTDQNINNVELAAAGAYNLTYRVTASDANQDDENKSFTLAPGFIQMHFVDENTGAVVSPSVTANGIAQSVTSGLVTVDLNNVDTSDYTILASLAGYTEREWFWSDVNQFSIISDVNALVLQTSRGASVDFNFSKPGGYTSLPNTIVELRTVDDNVSSRIETDSSGELTFFLNNTDVNYWLRVYDNNGETYDYNTVIVEFKVPKDEETLATITPFDVDLSGIGSMSYSGAAASVYFFMLPNTKDYYQLDLNAGSSYISRKLEVKYSGNPITDSIQTYLASVGDVTAVFYTLSSFEREVVPNILIKVFKEISGEGLVEIQSVTTDAAGTATMTFVYDDDYTFEFYDAEGDYLFTEELKVNFTAYYVYIDTSAIEWTVPSVERVSIRFNPPGGFLYYDSGGADVNQTIAVTDGNIAVVWVKVSRAGITISMNSYTSSCTNGCTVYPTTISASDLNRGQSIRVDVNVTTLSGAFYKQFISYVPLTGGYDIMSTLMGTSFRAEWCGSTDSNEPCFFFLIIAFLFTVAAIASVGVTVTRDTNALGIVALGVLGIFAYISWVPGTLFVLCCLAAFAMMVLERRIG